MKSWIAIVTSATMLCAGATPVAAESSVTNMTQRQFCQILSDYRVSYDEAMASNNQIKINSVIQSRSEDLDSLIPGGDFQDWQVEFLKATSTNTGDANICVTTCDGQVILQTGSVRKDSADVASSTIAHGSREYRAIAQLNINDLALISGRIVKVAKFQSSAKEFDYANELMDDETILTRSKCEEDLRTTLRDRALSGGDATDNRELEEKPQIFLFDLGYIAPIK